MEVDDGDIDVLKGLSQRQKDKVYKWIDEFGLSSHELATWRANREKFVKSAKYKVPLETAVDLICRDIYELKLFGLRVAEFFHKNGEPTLLRICGRVFTREEATRWLVIKSGLQKPFKFSIGVPQKILYEIGDDDNVYATRSRIAACSSDETISADSEECRDTMSIASVVGGVKSESLSEDETPAKTPEAEDVKPTLVNGMVAEAFPGSTTQPTPPMNTYMSGVDIKMESESPADDWRTPNSLDLSAGNVTRLSSGIRPIIVARSSSEPIPNGVRCPRDSCGKTFNPSTFNEAPFVRISNSPGSLRSGQNCSRATAAVGNSLDGGVHTPHVGHAVVTTAGILTRPPSSHRLPQAMYIVSSAPAASIGPVVRGNLIQHSAVNSADMTNPISPVFPNQTAGRSGPTGTSVVQRSSPLPSPVVTRNQPQSTPTPTPTPTSTIIVNRQAALSSKAEVAAARSVYTPGVCQLRPVTYVVAVARDNAGPQEAVPQRAAASSSPNVKHFQADSGHVEAPARDASSLSARYTDTLERYLAHFHITIGDFYNWLMKTYKTNTLLQEQLFVKADEFITLIAKLLFSLPDPRAAGPAVAVVHGVSESSFIKWVACKEAFKEDRTALKYTAFREILPAKGVSRNRFVPKLEAILHYRPPSERLPAAMPDVPNGTEKDFVDTIQGVLAYYMLRSSLLEDLPIKHNIASWRHMNCKLSPFQMFLHEIQTLVFHQGEVELFRSLFNYRDTAYFYETGFKRREAPAVRLLYRIPVAQVARSLISSCSDQMMSSFVKVPLRVDGSTNILGELKIDENSKKLTVPEEAAAETAATREKIRHVLSEYEKILR